VTKKQPQHSEKAQRERLDALLGHLTRRTAGVERDRARDVPLEPDFAEQAVVRENDQVLDQLSQEGREQIELVRRALKRLDEGVYGACEDCGAQIGAARLEALPYALTCVACARKREAAATP
jgi:RNA polymerase-binding transcription factor DksA